MSSPTVDAAFRWDGTTSDLAQQFYRRFLANDTAPSLSLGSSLPDAIQSRLDDVTDAPTFDKLPGLLQRALVWDAGFVINEFDDSLVSVRTLDGVSMAQIAVPLADYQSTVKCPIQTCSQPSGGAKWYKNIDCPGSSMLRATRCLVDTFESGQDPVLAMWSTGGSDSAIPALRLLKHTWNDATTHYEVAAIHTASRGLEPPYAKCAINAADSTTPGVGSLVIACDSPDTISSTKEAKMATPAPGAIASAWLREYVASIASVKSSSSAATSSPGADRSLDVTDAPASGSTTTTSSAPASASTTTLSPTTTTLSPTTTTSTGGGVSSVVVIVPAVVLVLLAVASAIWFYRRRRARESETSSSGPDPTPFLSPRPTRKDPRSSGFGGSVGGYVSAGSSHSAARSGVSAAEHAAYDAAVRGLLDDPSVGNKTIAYDALAFGDQVAAGAYGEVWVGYWGREVVALKRLLRGTRQSALDVEAFALEIQLTARLHHPHVVRFLGVAWDRPENLVMVLEYLPEGDLARLLRGDRGRELTWEQHKLAMARGLASAVAYLHAQSPAIIHRDLKARNVLLSDALEPKLIDFGVSRRKMDETMTAGVGTPFWTAPEVLEGRRYTEKSDMYSFGVLLTELDTCQVPYFDVSGDEGGMVHLKILNGVVAGKLRPSVTESCPERIRKVIVCCLRQDPEMRPTADEVLWMLAPRRA